LLAIAAIGFIEFWRRTRFWLPKYTQLLAAIGFIVMLRVLSLAPWDAPVNKLGPGSRLLLSLALPAIVYSFFGFLRRPEGRF
jgi:hypothetical protein